MWEVGGWDVHEVLTMCELESARRDNDGAARMSQGGEGSASTVMIQKGGGGHPERAPACYQWEEPLEGAWGQRWPHALGS